MLSCVLVGFPLQLAVNMTARQINAHVLILVENRTLSISVGTRIWVYRSGEYVVHELQVVPSLPLTSSFTLTKTALHRRLR